METGSQKEIIVSREGSEEGVEGRAGGKTSPAHRTTATAPHGELAKEGLACVGWCVGGLFASVSGVG